LAGLEQIGAVLLQKDLTRQRSSPVSVDSCYLASPPPAEVGQDYVMIMRTSVRYSIPLSAILLPGALFFSVLTPDATKPNGLIYLAYVGA
jgi:hypothetical protein